MEAERTPPRIVTGGGTTEWRDLVHRFGTVNSTMDQARALSMDGCPHGTVIVAKQQDAGRGRAGRGWVSPPGNLHATFVLRPGNAAQHAPQLAFVVAIAVAEAVDRLAGPGTALKWPNDVMRDGAKLAGILLERLEDGAVLAGIGMNVLHLPPDPPYAVTSLVALGCSAGLADVLATVSDALAAEWDAWRAGGFGPTLGRWMARGPALGAMLTVRQGEAAQTGRFAGLRTDGALLLDTPAGRQAFVAGDVQPCAVTAEGVKTNAC